MGVDQRGEPVDGDDRLLDLDPALSGERTSLLVGLEAPFGLGDAVLEQLLAFVQAGVAHFEFATPRCQHGGAGLELGAGFAAGFGRVGLGLFLRVERRQHRFEFGDASLLAIDQGRQLFDRTIQVVAFGGGLTTLTEHTRQALG
ncbi:MAG: hypothetical protein RLN74_06625, partial [Ilumatobacter fluminis]